VLEKVQTEAEKEFLSKLQMGNVQIPKSGLSVEERLLIRKKELES
jgi:hypothetical protein